MDFYSIVGSSVLGIIFAMQIFRARVIEKFAKIAFFLATSVALGEVAWNSVSLYRSWAEGLATRFFLPPYQSLGYFYYTIGTRFIAHTLLALLAAIIVPRVAEWLNKKYDERFFYREEFWLMRLGIFAVGYPGFFFYLAAVAGFEIGFSGIYSLLGKGRASMRYFWMPAGILTIILVSWFLPNEILRPFIF